MKRRTRQRLYRVVMYAIFIAVVAWAVLSTDWARFGKQFLDPAVAVKLFPEILTIALVNTLWFTLVGFVGGAVLGILLAMMKLSSILPYRWFATAWIELFRGLPALLTIFAVAFMLPIGLGIKIPGGPAASGLVGLILVSSAYMAEVIRAGIQAVPKGQLEASRSLGMSPTKTMIWVVLPQGFRIIIPPLTNEFVLLLKDTSLVFIAGSTLMTRELTTFARDLANQNANGTPLVMAAMLYLVVTIPLTRLAAWLERRMARQR
jgi:polar amino acid transport system permease protein